MKKDIICFHCGINKKSESPSRNPRPSDSDCTLISTTELQRTSILSSDLIQSLHTVWSLKNSESLLNNQTVTVRFHTLMHYHLATAELYNKPQAMNRFICPHACDKRTR